MMVLQAAAEATLQGRAAVLVTVIGANGSAPRRTGARMLVYPDETIVGTVGGGAFEYKLIEVAMEVFRTGHAQRYSVHLTRDLGMCCGGAMEAFVEPLEVNDQLFVYGAGHVGRALANVAVGLGFSVTMIDDRPDWIHWEERPEDVEIIDRDPILAVKQLDCNLRSFHLVTTHSHHMDQLLIEQLLQRDVGWIGMIGSSTKRARFNVRLKAAGIDEQRFSKVSSPVGLDIGAQTPEEIAISIAAELIRVRRSR